MSDWYEEMERAEQERDAIEYELSLEYERGRAEAEEEHKTMCETCIHKVSKEDIEQIRASAIDDVVKKLAESEDTILTDKQYYTLMELKEQKNEIN